MRIFGVSVDERAPRPQAFPVSFFLISLAIVSVSK